MKNSYFLFFLFFFLISQGFGQVSNIPFKILTFSYWTNRVGILFLPNNETTSSDGFRLQIEYRSDIPTPNILQTFSFITTLTSSANTLRRDLTVRTSSAQGQLGLFQVDELDPNNRTLLDYIQWGAIPLPNQLAQNASLAGFWNVTNDFLFPHGDSQEYIWNRTETILPDLTSSFDFSIMPVPTFNERAFSCISDGFAFINDPTDNIRSCEVFDQSVCQDLIIFNNQRFFFADDEKRLFTLNFNFPFYGEVKTTLFVVSNGYLSFVDDNVAAASNDCPLDSDDNPQSIFAMNWRDLFPPLNGTILVDNRDEFFAVRFEDIPNFSQNGRTNTFTGYIYPSGNLVVCLEEVDMAVVGVRGQTSSQVSIPLTSQCSSTSNSNRIFFFENLNGVTSTFDNQGTSRSNSLISGIILLCVAFIIICGTLTYIFIVYKIRQIQRENAIQIDYRNLYALPNKFDPETTDTPYIPEGYNPYAKKESIELVDKMNFSKNMNDVPNPDNMSVPNSDTPNPDTMETSPYH